MRIIPLLFLILINFNLIYAFCEDGQIDINSATKEELDKLYGIGPAKASAIIDARPFDSLDDLLDVNGIGEITLEKIKEQGLVCVEEKEIREADYEDVETGNNADEKISKRETNIKVLDDEKVEETGAEIIILNPKDIKTKNNNEVLNGNYAVYGLVAFCILLISLFILNRKRHKNEFE